MARRLGPRRTARTTLRSWRYPGTLAPYQRFHRTQTLPHSLPPPLSHTPPPPPPQGRVDATVRNHATMATTLQIPGFKDLKISVVGAGMMAEAMADGLKAKKLLFPGM